MNRYDEVVPSRGCAQSKGSVPPAVVSSKKMRTKATCAGVMRNDNSIWRGAAVKRRRSLAAPASIGVRRAVSVKRSW